SSLSTPTGRSGASSACRRSSSRSAPSTQRIFRTSAPTSAGSSSAARQRPRSGRRSGDKALLGRAIRCERGDDLVDVTKVLELVLEDPPHHLARGPSASHHDVVE